MSDTLMLRGIPPRLKGKIVKRVEQQGSNMNDVLVAVLSEHYGVPFAPTGVKRSGITAAEKVLLSISADLKQQILNECAANRMTQRNVAMQIIAAAFGETYEPTGRWEKPKGRGKRPARTAA